MHAETEQIIERPDDLTASWLADKIGAGAVADFAVERIGTGQMSECYRVELHYADAGADGPARPRSVVLKVAATDPVSRQTGLALGLYEREVRFYRDIAPRLGRPDRAVLPRRGRHRDRGVRPAARRCRARRSSVTKSPVPQPNRPCSVLSSWVGCTARCSATPRWPKRRGSIVSHR